METITYLISNYENEIFIITYGLLLLLFIIMIIQAFKISGLKKRYRLMFKGDKNNNIEDMIIKYKNDVINVIKAQEAIEYDIRRIESALKKAYSKSSLYKYDAFSGLAGRLSFVYVLLDSNNSGVILNGIYSNEGHYLYIKDVVNGKTEKELSKEEKGTLEKAIMCDW